KCNYSKVHRGTCFEYEAGINVMLAFSEFERGMSIEQTLGEKALARRDQDFWKGRPRSESTRLNSSHVSISYAVFCLKKKKKEMGQRMTDKQGETIRKR